MLTVAAMDVVIGVLVALSLLAPGPARRPARSCSALSFALVGLVLRGRHAGGRAGEREHARRVRHRRRGARRVVRAAGGRRHRRRHGLVALADRLGAEDPAVRGRACGGRSSCSSRAHRRARRRRGRARRAGGTSAAASSRPGPDARTRRRAWAGPSALATAAAAGQRSSAGASAILLTGVAYGSIADSINDFVKDNQALADIIAAQGGGSLADSYLAMSFRVLALVGAGFAIQSTLRLRSEETSLHAEQILATAVSRVRWACEPPRRGVRRHASWCSSSPGSRSGSPTRSSRATARRRHRSRSAPRSSTRPRSGSSSGSRSRSSGSRPRAAAAGGASSRSASSSVCSASCSTCRPGWRTSRRSSTSRSCPAADLSLLPLVVLAAVAAALTAVGLAGLRRRDIG